MVRTKKEKKKLKERKDLYKLREATDKEIRPDLNLSMAGAGWTRQNQVEAMDGKRITKVAQGKKKGIEMLKSEWLQLPAL